MSGKGVCMNKVIEYEGWNWWKEGKERREMDGCRESEWLMRMSEERVRLEG